jgi:predicted permease
MNWLRRRQRERDLERELRADLELEVEEQRENGLAERDARYAARRAFGNVTLIEEDTRAMWGWGWVETFLQDLRFGFRTLVKSPGVTIAVVISLALGLGATAALFSLLNSLLFKPLPVAEPRRLVVLRHGTPGELDPTFAYPQFKLLRDEARGSVDLFASSNESSQLRSGAIDTKVGTAFVSGDFFWILGVRPHLGRLIAPADDLPGSPTAMAAVVSYRFWRRAFQGDPSVVGRKVLIDGVPVTVAGVTGPTFFGAEVGVYPDVWLPFASKPALSPQFKMLECKGCYWLNVMGRVRGNGGLNRAEAGLNVLWTNVRRTTIPESMPERYKPYYFSERLWLVPGATGDSTLRERFTRPLYVLLAMTGVILLIACSNIANLLMARAVARQRELAIRLSIGARRGRLIRQLLTESALVAAAGLVAGGVVYLFSINGLLRFLESGTARYYLDTTPDLRMAGFIVGLALATLGLFGLTTAIRATRWRLSGALAETSQSIAARSPFGKAALAGQLALSFTLLVAAILLAWSLYDLRTFHAGFRRDHLLMISPDTSRVIHEREQLLFTQAVLSAVRNLPGVKSASASVVLPMEGSSWQRDFTTPGYVARGDADYDCYENLISPDFFRTMGTRLVAGRDLTERDDAAAPKAAVVNESFARRYWKDGDALGKQIRSLDEKEFITVVGVVEDAKYREFRRSAPPTVYLPLAQVPSTMGWSPNLELWTGGDPHWLIAPVREILKRRLGDVPVEFQSFEELIDKRLLYERLLTVLSVSFGALALAICAVGIYGIAAYSVNRRTAEIGIRMALGASPGAVLRLIMREHMILVLAGLCAGAMGTVLAMRFLRTWLFGVSPGDVPTMAASVLTLAGITALATLIPALRAAGTQPVAALRHQ